MQPDFTNINPLTEEHLVQLNEGLAAAEVGLKRVEMAKRAGIDTGTAEQQLIEARDKILAIKGVYFPGR